MRVTRKTLEGIVSRINRIHGYDPGDLWYSPTWRKRQGGPFKPGRFHLDISGIPTRYTLHQVQTPGGGVRNVLGFSLPAGEMYVALHSYIRGLEDAAH